MEASTVLRTGGLEIRPSEFVALVDGELTLELDGVPHLVGAGDAIAFVADRPHAYRNLGDKPLRYSLSVIHRDQPSRPVPMPPR